ncbi:hypothetical protein WBG78_07280 [Chryseolinea sp. T2]|uniref:hypothetical protein n=1 Tax=Chryseolinea sp. T2 TaxID=3129255 RepID=UPI003077FB83
MINIDFDVPATGWYLFAAIVLLSLIVGFSGRRPILSVVFRRVLAALFAGAWVAIAYALIVTPFTATDLSLQLVMVTIPAWIVKSVWLFFDAVLLYFAVWELVKFIRQKRASRRPPN